jgi:hypothetical protein
MEIPLESYRRVAESLEGCATRHINFQVAGEKRRVEGGGHGFNPSPNGAALVLDQVHRRDERKQADK